MLGRGRFTITKEGQPTVAVAEITLHFEAPNQKVSSLGSELCNIVKDYYPEGGTLKVDWVEYPG